MDPSTDHGELEPVIAAWVEATLGGSLARSSRTSVGGSRLSYFVDVAGSDGAVTKAVLRLEAGGSFTGTEINVAKEAVVYRALRAAGVPVPGVLGVGPGGAALLLEWLSGDTTIPDEHVDTVLRSFARIIGDMHLIPVDELELPDFRKPRTAAEHAQLDLSTWESLAILDPQLDALVRYAGAWLSHHPPTEVSKTALVQGDTGPGNFLVDGDRITGLCDMEFAHLGDPMDDIAWMVMRMGRVVDDVEPYLEEYTRHSGIPLNRSSLEFYAVAVQYRCAVTASLAVARGGGARGFAPYLLVAQRFLRDLASALSGVTGVEPETPDLPDMPPTPRTDWYDAVLEAFRAGVRGIGDSELREQTRNQQILVHYLRAFDRVGLQLEALEAEDAAKTVGIDPRNLDSLGELAGRAGAEGDHEFLAYLLRRRARNAVLWSSLLDRNR